MEETDEDMAVAEQFQQQQQQQNDIAQTYLPVDQLRRVERMREQPIYLLSVAKTENQYWFIVMGSQQKKYRVKLNTEAVFPHQLVKCDCMDAKNRSWISKFVCKHGCYVLLKVLKMPIDVLIEGRVRNHRQLRLHARRVLFERGGENASLNLKRSSSSSSSNSEIESEDAEGSFPECMICFDLLRESTCQGCPQCRQVFHVHCLEQWFEVDQSQCPHCRASMQGLVV